MVYIHMLWYTFTCYGIHPHVMVYIHMICFYEGTGVNGVNEKAGGVSARTRRHLDYLFSSEEPEEDFLYFGVK